MVDFIGVRGGAEIARALEEFGANIERNMMRGALRDGAQVIQNDAKARVPQDTGALRESIRVRTGRKGAKVYAYVVAGSSTTKKTVKKSSTRPSGIKVEYSNPWYAHLVEYGVKRHVIIAGGGTKAGKALAAGARILGEKVDHPGTTAKPFMRPALDTKAQSAIDIIADYLRKRIAKGK